MFYLDVHIVYFTRRYVMCCVIWHHLYNLKNVKNTHGRVLFLVKLQALKPATLLKVTFLHGCFSRFLNRTNGTKSSKTSHIVVYLTRRHIK